MNKERYGNLDGMRAYACIGIVLRHVLANGYSNLRGFMFERFIPSLTNFTYFFMIVSAFSMCCGYYRKIQNNEIKLEQFYKRRYQRIWPFFALLCTIEMLINHNINSVYDWFADLTLVFGLIPLNGIKVVGVGWFLGTIFVFYMLFPFYVFLLKEKKRAWLVLGVCFILHILCNVRYIGATGEANIIFSSIFFVSGGLIYLYRGQLQEYSKTMWILFIALAATVIFYFIVNDSVLTLLILFVLLTIIGIMGGRFTKTLFQNKIIRFIGDISMEIYLCHMFVYRTFEKIKILNLSSNVALNYLCISLATLCGACIFASGWKKLWKR